MEATNIGTAKKGRQPVSPGRLPMGANGAQAVAGTKANKDRSHLSLGKVMTRDQFHQKYGSDQLVWAYVKPYFTIGREKRSQAFRQLRLIEQTLHDTPVADNVRTGSEIARAKRRRYFFSTSCAGLALVSVLGVGAYEVSGLFGGSNSSDNNASSTPATGSLRTPGASSASPDQAASPVKAFVAANGKISCSQDTVSVVMKDEDHQNPFAAMERTVRAQDPSDKFDYVKVGSSDLGTAFWNDVAAHINNVALQGGDMSKKIETGTPFLAPEACHLVK